MTVYLALDPLPGIPLASGGHIVGLNSTQQGVIDALAARATATSQDYTEANRVVSIDETDDTVWDMDVAPDAGWYYAAATGAISTTPPRTFAQQVAHDIARFQEAVEREAREWERVVAEENFQPHTDSGHAWSSDLLHALIKPNIRLQFLRLEAAKASPTAEKITAYTSPTDHLSLDAFLGAAAYGVLTIYRQAVKATWRPLRAGGSAYGYDVATGNIRVVDTSPVQAAVAYPPGETVATWDALQAVRNL